MRSTFRKHAASLLLALGSLIGTIQAAEPEKAAATAIFDGKTLEGWKVTDFAGRGEVKVEDGQIVLEAGNDLTGVNYTKETPKTGYEIKVEAMRLEGGDFFCGLTFPVKDACVTFIVGGWGGSLIGISSINGDDASENETTTFKKFESKKWYKIRVRVTDKLLETWIDEEPFSKVELADKKLSMRAGEIEMSQPFGFATFRTKATLRNITLDKLKP